jgi:hypothetical protein
MAIDINPPSTDPETLKKQERNKLWEELSKQKALSKQKKADDRKKIRDEYVAQSIERKRILKICQDDIKNKLTYFKQQVRDKKLEQKEGKLQFKKYRNERIQQFRGEEQKIFNLSSDELKKSSSYRFKRWFFGVGKEFSRVS